MEPWCSTLYHAYWVRVILVCFAVEWQTNINKKNNKCGPTVEDVSVKALINLNSGFSGGRICYALPLVESKSARTDVKNSWLLMSYLF